MCHCHNTGAIFDGYLTGRGGEGLDGGSKDRQGQRVPRDRALRHDL